MAYRGKTPTGSHAGGGVRIYSYCFGDRLPPFAHSTAKLTFRSSGGPSSESVGNYASTLIELAVLPRWGVWQALKKPENVLAAVSAGLM